MKREGQSALWSAALFCGALWGLAEATAGHVLHILRIPGLAGFVMFPLGFILMSRAFRRSGSIVAVFLTSWIAAGIKMADLLLPGADFLAVWNPAQAILLEGVAAAGLLLVLKKARATAGPAALASLSWRLAYLAINFLWVELLDAGNLYMAGPLFFVRFVVLDSLLNGLVIHFLMRMRPFKTDLPLPIEKTAKKFRQPALAAILLITALSLELIL